MIWWVQPIPLKLYNLTTIEGIYYIIQTNICKDYVWKMIMADIVF